MIDIPRTRPDRMKWTRVLGRRGLNLNSKIVPDGKVMAKGVTQLMLKLLCKGFIGAIKFEILLTLMVRF